MIELSDAVIAVTAWLGGVLGAFVAIRTDLRWLRRDIDRAHERLDLHDEMLMNELRRSGL